MISQKYDVVERKFFRKSSGQIRRCNCHYCQFFQFARTMVAFDMNNLDSFPLILLCVSKFAEFFYNNEFKDLHNKNLAVMPWLPHTLLTFLQKYFQTCTPAGTQPKKLRGNMAQEPIYSRTFKEAEIILPRLMDIIRFCVVGYNMDMMVCPPPHHLTPLLPLLHHQEEI